MISYKLICYRPNSCTASTNMLSFFCQHRFCPQNKAISRNLAAVPKRHQCPGSRDSGRLCLSRAAAPAELPRGQGHSGCASPTRMHNRHRTSAVREVSLRSVSLVCSSAVVFLSPFKARLLAFKNGVPNQEDLCSRLACWGLSSFPSIQRGFATVAATDLRKTEEKKLKSQQ